MGGYTSFKAGGIAETLLIPESIDELKEALAMLVDTRSEYIVIGNGTNILVSDSGYNGTIIKIGKAFSGIEINGEEVIAGAGALLSSVASASAEAGLSGLEFASGIPGSIGGAVYMNAGAYEGEMKDVVKRVDILSKDGLSVISLDAGEMKFSYRYSALQETGGIAISVTLKLVNGCMNEIKEKTRKLAELRNSKQPVSMPSAGSFFKRPPGYFAGKLIEEAGLKGLTVGGAQISPLHAGFIVNKWNATASDIIDLMYLVIHTVFDKFEVKLEPEVKIIGDY
jgi:UDP-N-acetylmuramate dehydrogenase